MRGGPNRYLISTEQKYNTSVQAPGGMEFFIDPGIDKEWNVRTWGKVKATPTKFSEWPTMLVDDYNYDYGWMRNKEVKRPRMVPSSWLWMDVDEGDVVHFRYHVQDNDNTMMIVDGEPLICIMADDILAKEVDGELIPQGGKIILERQMIEKEVSKIVHVPDFLKQDSVWKVHSVGRPLRFDNPLNVKKGDAVFLAHEPAQQDFGKGRTYFVAYQRDITAILA